MLLKNKTAIITGCNKGIGKVILNIFAENDVIEGGEVRILNDDEIIAKIKNPEDIIHVY